MGAIIEHDCVIGDNVQVAKGARLAGKTQVGRMSHTGSGATVLQRIDIGENVTVGAGAVIVKTVASGSTVASVPASPLLRKYATELIYLPNTLNV